MKNYNLVVEFVRELDFLFNKIIHVKEELEQCQENKKLNYLHESDCFRMLIESIEERQKTIKEELNELIK